MRGLPTRYQISARYRYRVVYLPADEGVVVLRVLHARQEFARTRDPR